MPSSDSLSDNAYGFGTLFSKCPNTENIRKKM